MKIHRSKVPAKKFIKSLRDPIEGTFRKCPQDITDETIVKIIKAIVKQP